MLCVLLLTILKPKKPSSLSLFRSTPSWIKDQSLSQQLIRDKNVLIRKVFPAQAKQSPLFHKYHSLSKRRMHQ